MGNGIIFGAAMAEKKQENGASEVFGCIPHGTRVWQEMLLCYPCCVRELKPLKLPWVSKTKMRRI